ncbi:hypothetical protein DFH29DRAFT_872717 [Suillus ampliporus]|nr:hypothetical protein DFH29DRAFT_872717 [Suillus ampliporus]
MLPKKRARSSTVNAQDDTAPCRQSSRSNRSVGGHAAQLQKAGEAIAAPRSRWKGQNDYPKLDASDPEENSMAPAQLCRGKKSAPAKPPAAKNATKRKPASATPPTTSNNLKQSSQKSSDNAPTSTTSAQRIEKASQSSSRRMATQEANERDDDDDDDRESVRHSHEYAPFEDGGDDEGDLDGGDGGDLGQERDWEDKPMDVEGQDNETYDVLEHHQAQNGQCKAPSPSYLSKVTENERAHASTRSESPPQRPSRHNDRSRSPHQRPSQHTGHSGSRQRVPSAGASSVRVPPSRRLHANACIGTHSHSRSATPAGARRTRNIKTNQENPSKLGFYPPCWQGFLQAAKLQMRLQAILTHPIPEHQDAVQLAQEVLDAELWSSHVLLQGYFLEYGPQMCQLLCDDLFTFRTELKKVVISIAKLSYDIFPKGTAMRPEEIKNCIVAAATKLLKTGDYLRIPDSSNGKFKNFVSQALKDVCLKFFYSNSKKALKNTDDFCHTIPVNALILVAAVMKGVISGFSETGTDKVPELSADRCRTNFDKLRKSVEKLLDIPECREELEEMLDQWAKIGMGEFDWHADGSDAGSDAGDVNIIL